MDLGWGNPKARNFVTTVGLITSDGPNGQNIMAAEWTYYVSYSPALISVHIGKGGKATEENIRATKVFGVSIVSESQNAISSIAGGFSGKEVDKVGMLREFGASFKKGEKTGVLLLEGAALHAECRLREVLDMGDHFMFLGEVLSMESHDAKPIIYHQGKYWKFGAQIRKPAQETLDRIGKLSQKYAKKPA